MFSSSFCTGRCAVVPIGREIASFILISKTVLGFLVPIPMRVNKLPELSISSTSPKIIQLL